MEIHHHFWDFLKLGRVRVVLDFHEPISTDDVHSRKVLSFECEKTIAQSVEANNARYATAS